jgi:hypothetical protein
MPKMILTSCAARVESRSLIPMGVRCGLRASRSPSPQPSPQGRGRIVGSRSAQRESCELSRAGRSRCSRSLRVGRSAQLDESGGRIPTGFRLKAQGCEQRATLGKGTRARSTPTGLRRLRGGRRPQPRWGWHLPTQFTQASSLLATLGWRTQSLRDWRREQRTCGERTTPRQRAGVRGNRPYSNPKHQIPTRTGQS